MTKYNVLELFSGTGSVGKIAKRRKMNVISIDNEEKFNPTLAIDILKWKYKKDLEDRKFIPDFIWASPPCNSWSTLAYVAHSRDPKTLKPLKPVAVLGEKLVNKSIQIINYYLKKNPKLLWVIENPKAMLRKWNKMKKYQLSMTTYCAYNFPYVKPTDFFNNFPDGIKLKDPVCKKKTYPIASSKGPQIKREVLYRVPPKLVGDILTQFKKQYGRIKGKEKKDYNKDATVKKFGAKKGHCPPK